MEQEVDKYGKSDRVVKRARQRKVLRRLQERGEVKTTHCTYIQPEPGFIVVCMCLNEMISSLHLERGGLLLRAGPFLKICQPFTDNLEYQQ